MELKHYSLGTTALLAGLLFSASGQVAAQQSASAAAMLEEVVVTARRREESMQDLPLSVAAITADGMQAQGIYDIMDISDHVPNLNFTNTGRRGVTAIFIRGIGNDSPGSLQPVGAGTYIDGHYLPNTVGNMLNTVDIERIEVLRGPQGTLFGKNTTGGAINIVSAKPQGEFEADALLRMADYGQQDFRGMVNVPFNDSVAARFSYANESSDGYYFNNVHNEDWGATDLEAFSAAVRFTPNDNWTIDLGFRGNYQEDHNAPGSCRTNVSTEQAETMAGLGFVYDGPTFDDGVGQWGGGNGHLEKLYPGATLDYWNECDADAAQGDYVTSSSRRNFLELDNENINATIQWDSAGEAMGMDNVNLKFIASSHETDYNYIQDRDYSSINIDAIGTPPVDGPGQVRTTDNIEFIFTGDVSDSVSFVLGVNIFDDESLTGQGNCLNATKANLDAIAADFLVDGNGDPILDGDGLPQGAGNVNIPCMADGGTQFDWLTGPRVSGAGPHPGGMSGIITAESTAVFGHVTWDLSDNWTLDFGARWTDEDRTFNQVELGTVPGTCNLGGPGDPPVTSFCTPDYELNFNSVFIDGFYNDAAANFSETTPMVSLTRNFEDGMMYFLLAEGFLSGAFNDELNVTLKPEFAPLLTYQPEHVTNYEVGYKGSLLDGRLQIAADIFYMDYQDKQEQINIQNDGSFGGDPQIGITTNAASVDITGIEFELRSSPWEGGFFSVDVGYLDAEYGEFTSFDESAGDVDQTDATIADYAPEWTINATIEHAFQIGNGATLTPQLGMYWQDSYNFEGSLDSDSATAGEGVCKQPSYTKFRARATYVPASGNWQASLYGQNITDERYMEWCAEGRSGTFYSRYGRPSTWGLEFNYRWGS